MKKFLALIPARKGSLGIKNKNMTKINNYPLIYYTIKSCLKSNFLNEIYVSSDSSSILKYAKKMKIKTLKRPKKYSSSTSDARAVVYHFLSKINLGYSDYIVYLQPTSPCRNFRHIDRAIKLILKHKKPIISVTKNNMLILKSFLLKKNVLKCPFIKKYYNHNRQQLPDTYRSNGAIYIFTKRQFLKNDGFPSTNSMAFKMTERESFDIDDKKQIPLVENILKKNIKNYNSCLKK